MDDKIIHATYSKNFMGSYAGKVIQNPSIAAREVVMNTWDAGAQNVIINWPKSFDSNELIEIIDDGSGMTYDDFCKIWPEASYNRMEKQGKLVHLDDGTTRIAYGKNGIGRFGMFCFSSEYEVETWKNGKCNVFRMLR